MSLETKDEGPGLICLGASAGGLRSLEAVVGALPPDLPWPVLVSQHLQADRASQMPLLLARVTRLRVREAVDGEALEAGTVYTCPSEHEMGLTPEGRIAFRPPRAGKPGRIDHLFATAAFARPGRVVAVVLSGTGTDGAVGSLVVKLNGGTVLSESGATALHTGMPSAAERAGSVDATLPANELAPLIASLASGTLDEATAATRVALREIAEGLTTATGTEFSGYRVATLRRRVESRRAIRGDATLDAYRARLHAEPAEREALVRSLLIPVTEFFRDPAAWQAVEAHVIPRLAKRAAAGERVRVWCVGCASGEEAYTIAILLAENLPDRRLVEIVATDLDPSAIAAATNGTYGPSRMAGVDATRRERFFHATDAGHRVDESLARMVRFSAHDVTRDPPPGTFDLIVCRNVLIYFEDELQARTIEAFHGALAEGGALFLGRSEAIPRHHHAFDPIVRPMRLFEAKRSVGPARPLLDAASSSPATTPTPYAAEVAAVLLETPEALVLTLDASWRVTSANPRAHELVGRDVVGERLLDIFPGWQGSPVHDALRDSFATGRSLTVRGALASWGHLDLSLEPLTGPERAAVLIATPAEPRPPQGSGMAVIREDLAATNDELQSANEELAATNEELQAANEELASLNEEFLSTNQALASTNAELQALASQAKPDADLIRGILHARSEAIVACDADRRITLVNRRAAELFALKDDVLGRDVQAAGLAPEAEVGSWLDRAHAGPVREDVSHGAVAFLLVVQALAGPGGTPLGWVLTWSLPAEHPRQKR